VLVVSNPWFASVEVIDNQRGLAVQLGELRLQLRDNQGVNASGV
jgi:hypothetical protein